MLPRISIVTLSFNQAPFLAAAIESILGQGYANLDYIVVDPGSRDDSRAIIDRYRGRIDTLLLEPDQGPSDGLNKGFAAATGDIFGYINADDLMLPGSLDRIAAYFADPAITAILGQGCVIDRDGKIIRRAGSSRFSLADFGHGAITYLQQGHYFRRSAYARTRGFNIDNRTCWDAELLVDMALAGVQPINVPDALGAFRLYGETITGSGRLAEQMARDIARLKARALGRGPRARDRIVAPLRLMARRLADPATTLDGLRARWQG
ncbi:MAG: glycosyl transferase family protein [Pseudomonadota bacterium]|jgi:glycosyltransferase involved in cell wall biosynthesis